MARALMWYRLGKLSLVRHMVGIDADSATMAQVSVLDKTRLSLLTYNVHKPLP
jgi:hypothetical protein